MNQPKVIVSRRRFIQRAAGAALVSAVFPSLVPASVLGAEGQVAPSNRLTVACIGVGPQGTGDMRVFLGQPDARVVAVCDVKEDQRNQARDLVNETYRNQDCAAYRDFREIMARQDIDACLIATPDHWHVLVALAAVNSGKDVYVEKPLGCSLAEDQALRAAVRQTQRIFQFGTQQRSDRNFRLACELVRNGRIGQLKQIHVWAPGSAPGGSTKVVPPPSTLDYDFWLGPAPFKPHTEDRCSADGYKKTWWFITDYSFGFITGWGIHPMDIALWGGGPSLTGSVEIEGQGNYPTEGACNTATTWDINYRFASGVTLTFAGTPNKQNMGQPTGEPWPHLDAWQERYGKINTHGTSFEGSEGWILVDRAQLVTRPESLAKISSETLPIQLKPSKNHVRDFLDSIKSRKPTVCPVEDALLADVMCQAGDVAARLGRKLTFDLKTEKFVRDTEADRYLQLRQMRAPWKV